MKREHLVHFTIAGFSYHEGALAFTNLKIGTKLTLVFEPDNGFDPRAIAIYFEDKKLGYIPRHCNETVCNLYN